MLRRIVVALVLCLLYATPAWATRQRLFGYCSQGGTAVTVAGTPGSGTQRFQQTFRGCSVQIYLVGTTTNATLYSDDAGTAQANPFTASSTTGFWSAYVDGGRFDVRYSGGGIGVPFTISDYRVPNATFDITDFGAKCDGTANDYTAVNNARIAATAQTNGGTVLIPGNVSGACLINTSITFDLDVTLAFENGGRISMASATTATIRGSVSAAPVHIFAGAGNVVFGADGWESQGARVDKVYPQWWGALADGAADDLAAIDKAVLALVDRGGGQVYFVPGAYMVTDGIHCRNNTEYVGAGWDSIIRARSNSNGNLLCKSVASDPFPFTGIIVRNLRWDGNRANVSYNTRGAAGATDDEYQNIIRFNQVSNSRVEDCYIHNSVMNGISIYLTANNNVIQNNRIEDIGKVEACPSVDGCSWNGIFLEANVSRNSILHNKIINTKQAGIILEGPVGNIPTDNIIDGNSISGTIEYDGIQLLRGGGASANYSRRTRITNNIVTGVNDATNQCIRVSANGGSVMSPLISGNVCFSNSGGGILIADSGVVGATVSSNVVTANTGVGITVASSAVVSSNTVSNNGGVGISVTGTGVTVSSNAVTGNTGVGIAVAAGTDVMVAGNISLNNAGGNFTDTGTRTIVSTDNIFAASFTPISVQIGYTATAAAGSTIMANNVTQNSGSVALTTGVWEVWGVASYVPDAGTLFGRCGQGINTVSATLGAQGTFTDHQLPSANQNTFDLTTPNNLLTLTANTTVYLVTRCGYTTANVFVYGNITARKIR